MSIPLAAAWPAGHLARASAVQRLARLERRNGLGGQGCWTELYKSRVAHTESCDALAYSRRSSGACRAVDTLVLLNGFRCAVTTPHAARRGLRIGAVQIITSSIIRLIVMLLEYTSVYAVERVAIMTAIGRVLLFSSQRLEMSGGCSP